MLIYLDMLTGISKRWHITDKISIPLGKFTQMTTFDLLVAGNNGHRPNTTEIVWQLLSWKVAHPSSTIELNKLLENGLPVSAIDSFSKMMGIPMTEIAPMLNLSYKTLTRKKRTETFDPAISSLVYEIVATYARAIDIFGDTEKVSQWFGRANRALANQRPIELLKTMTGINLVNQILGRIEEGVYS